MKVSAISIIVGLSIAAFVGFGLMVRQCQSKQSAEDERDRLKDKNAALRDTTNLLVRLVLREEQTIGSLNQQISKGQIQAAKKQEEIRQAVARNNQAIAAMSEKDRRIAALKQAVRDGVLSLDRLKDSLNSNPIFTDEEANRIYLQTARERDMWRDSTQAVYEQLGQEQQRTSELEDALNGTNRAVANARTYVQGERAKATGLFSRKRRRVLEEVDRKLQSVQK